MSVIVPRHRCLVLRKNGATARPDDDITFAAEPVPSWTTAPAISGTAKVGETLTVSNGTVSSGSVTARQWRRGASNIAPATSGTYALVEADEGAMISCRLTATGAGGTNSTSAAAVGPIAAADPGTPASTLLSVLSGTPLTSAINGAPLTSATGA